MQELAKRLDLRARCGGRDARTSNAERAACEAIGALLVRDLRRAGALVAVGTPDWDGGGGNDGGDGHGALAPAGGAPSGAMAMALMTLDDYVDDLRRMLHEYFFSKVGPHAPASYTQTTNNYARIRQEYFFSKVGPRINTMHTQTIIHTHACHTRTRGT